MALHAQLRGIPKAVYDVRIPMTTTPEQTAVREHKTNVRTHVVAIVGLGYVGLPLAAQFGKSGLRTIGYEINQQRVAELSSGSDSTNELSGAELAETTIEYTSAASCLREASVIIVTVPTPITKSNQPDLSLVKAATKTVGQNLSQGAIVAYESTVYPGVTEEVCVPILEQTSGMKWKEDFFVGYSPERVNPGDKEHTIDKIVKVVSGDTPETLNTLSEVYGSICRAGVHKAPNIKTAEAAKVIENTQRDLNIALANELSLIFHRIGINTMDVMKAAGTKWNFHMYQPGLVGGHCIGVDPYYLVSKAEELGYHPDVIAAGRRINDSMAEFVADETVKTLIRTGKQVQGASVLVLGLAFKENIPDFRNSKIRDTIAMLKTFGIHVTAHDPFLSEETIRDEFGVSSSTKLSGTYDAVIISTPHDRFGNLEETIPSLLNRPGAVIDVKSRCRGLANNPDIAYWSL